MIRKSWAATAWLAIGAAVFAASGCGGGGGGGSDGGNGGGATSFSVSGTLTAAAGTVMDSDVNDPFAPHASNNLFGSAQDVPNPASIGGFVTATATGVSGDRFAAITDVNDLYRATLSAGQTITLAIADHPGGGSLTPDLDLFLYDEADTGSPVDWSLSLGPDESVTVPADGTYYIVVGAEAGRSNYQLTIQQTAFAASAPLAAPTEFVPGEVLVRFKDTTLASAAVTGLAERAAQLGLRGKAGAPGRTMLFELPLDAGTRARTLGALNAREWPRLGGRAGGVDDATQLKLDTLRAVKALRGRADVASADLNYIHRPLAVPDDTHYGRQWHYPLINLPQAWDIEDGTSNEVIVAVVDTGVMLSHPDLAGVTVAGYDFISDAGRARDGDGIDPNADDPGDAQVAGASSFHGTHVAGTVAAASNNAAGVAGVSWGAKVMPIRVLGQGGGSSYDIIQGIRYAAGLSNDSGSVPTQPAHIINLSLGCQNCFSQTDQDAYTAVRNAGVIIIAAAGNENTATLGYPASYAGVVSVAAVDRNKHRAPYSNFGSAIDVAAPGGDASVDGDGDGYVDGVLSTGADDSSGSRQANFRFEQGTSMAAPHMAGVVALMKARNPAAVTPDALDAWLTAGSITEDVAGNGDSVRDDTYGYGLIDALKAVQVAGGGAMPTALTVSPNTLNFGAATANLALTLGKSGGGTLTVTAVTETATWLSVTGPGNLDGLGQYSLSVDRTGLAAGAYATSLTLDYSVDGDPRQLSLPVSMQVGGGVAGAGDTGFTWIILIDPDSGDTVDTTTAENQGGSYSFSFSEIPNGSYYVLGGSDSDNDGFLCDNGESCGGYPTLAQFQTITVEGGNVTGVDFLLNFPGELGVNAATVGKDKGYRRGTPTKQAEED